MACLELGCEMPAGRTPVRREVVEHDFLIKTILKHGIECNTVKGQYCAMCIEELTAERPTLVFFLAPTNLSNHMDSQARTGDTVLVR